MSNYRAAPWGWKRMKLTRFLLGLYLFCVTIYSQPGIIIGDPSFLCTLVAIFYIMAMVNG